MSESLQRKYAGLCSLCYMRLHKSHLINCVMVRHDVVRSYNHRLKSVVSCDDSISTALYFITRLKSCVFNAVADKQRNYRYTKVKGISPLLASVLLIATTVVILTMLAGWMSSTTSATQNTISNRTSEGVACAAAEIVIDDVYAGAGSGSIARAIVRNSGGSDNLAITSAQLYDKFGNNFTTVNALPSSLNKGQMATLNFNYSILPTTTNDSAHGVNNGTLINGLSWSLSGKYLGGLNFDGANVYINISNESNFDFERTSLFSIGAWVKVAVNSSNVLLISKTNDQSKGWTVWIRDGSNNFSVILRNITVTNDLYASSNNTPVPNEWHYVAVTYNGSSLVSGVKYYLDGIEKPLYAIRDGLTESILNDDNVLIGRRASSYYNGTIDDAAIWNRSLTNAEINTSMNAGPLTVSNTNDLVGYWKFDEGKGVLSCPSDFSRVVVTTSCGGVSAEFTKPPKC